MHWFVFKYLTIQVAHNIKHESKQAITPYLSLQIVNLIVPNKNALKGHQFEVCSVVKLLGENCVYST